MFLAVIRRLHAFPRLRSSTGIPWFSVQFLIVFSPVGIAGKFFSLPEGYDKYEMPNKFQDKPWLIELNLRDIQIMRIDQIDGNIKADLYMTFSWRDERINMSTVEDPSFSKILNPGDMERLWKPDLRVVNMEQLITNRGITDTRVLFLSYGHSLKYTIRAILTVKCNFDFALYPIDTQICVLDMLVSRLNQVDNCTLQWEKENTLRKMVFSLPLYHVHICSRPRPVERRINPSFILPQLRVFVVLDRQIKTHLLQMYLPSTIFVILSWGSFVVPPEMVPGRMALLVTSLLSLVTMLVANRASSPPSLGVTCSEAWLIMCIMFLFLALLQYIYVLILARRSTGACTSDKEEERLFTRRRFLKSPKTVKQRKLLKKVMVTIKECFTRNDKGIWGIQDRTAIVLFPLLFIACLCVYISYVVTQYHVWEETQRGWFTECWREQ